jgi:DNA-binding CsgD family transcriptional regulator/tetratricopeptide (TPR) repeat protein
LARERYDYHEALLRYGEALKSSAFEAEDEPRISVKYASALFFGREPENARKWFDRALTIHRLSGITSSNAVEAGTLLLRLSRQYWLNADTISALALISEAVQLGTMAKNAAFSARANLAMAHYLILLGRHEAAEPFFEQAGNVLQSDQPETRAVSLTQRAILYSARGNRDDAYALFEEAAEVAKALPDGYQVTSIWDDYAIWAMALGDLGSAQVCWERALLVARDRHIAWRIVYLSLRYAQFLLELEQYDRARELVLDALTYDIVTPCVSVLVAAAGLRLGTILNDEGLTRRCVQEGAIDYAFLSGEPGRIGPLVSAAIRSHTAQGKHREAVALLSRGIKGLLSADHAWDVLLDAAIIGGESDQRTARSLLARRAALPNGRVALAYLKLFDANIAQRRKRADVRDRHGIAAAAMFESIGWLAHRRMALSLIAPSAQKKQGLQKNSLRSSFRPVVAGASKLTKREEEIAELVLQGFTNRDIARELSISENTVESHMTSIMNRLGIRSRHQLVDTLTVAESGMTPPV